MNTSREKHSRVQVSPAGYIQLAIGGIALAGGIWLTVYASHAKDVVLLTVIGLVSANLGSVLISWSLAQFLGKRTANSEMIEHIDAINRNLSQSIGRVKRAVQQVQADEISVETGLALVAQAANGTSVQIAQLQRMIGEDMDDGSLVDVIRTMDSVARKIDESPDATAREASVELKEHANLLRSSALLGSRRTAQKTAVTCPYCETENFPAIGSQSGDSAMVACVSCGEQFHAHRGADGRVFARKAGSRIDVAPQIELQCPNCAGSIKYRARTNERSRMIVCFSCGQALYANGVGEISASGIEMTLNSVDVDQLPDMKSRIRKCPECSASINCFVVMHDRALGFCERDHVILEFRTTAAGE
jgi:DNA-directed RNA polymerase subunit M/transcription elongation factor TFIIS